MSTVLVGYVANLFAWLVCLCSVNLQESNSIGFFPVSIYTVWLVGNMGNYGFGEHTLESSSTYRPVTGGHQVLLVRKEGDNIGQRRVANRQLTITELMLLM